ncbi:hypothetical protein AB0957_34735 [Streptomyces zhihengii]|uniref:hypothetical protein n=1 Tax=Streptomyces zhihengii TaxID=1818004 RepID=UPI0034545051
MPTRTEQDIRPEPTRRPGVRTQAARSVSVAVQRRYAARLAGPVTRGDAAAQAAEQSAARDRVLKAVDDELRAAAARAYARDAESALQRLEATKDRSRFALLLAGTSRREQQELTADAVARRPPATRRPLGRAPRPTRPSGTPGASCPSHRTP